MTLLKRLFDFYIQSSIHVAFSCYALVRMTEYMFQIPNNKAMVLFGFFGTIVGYNFVKYDALARTGKREPSYRVKAIALLSFFSILAAGYCFLKLENATKVISAFFLGLTILYTLPFFPNRKNARNWAGVKIYIVSICWVGVTVVLPVLNADPELQQLFNTDFYLKITQRFLLVFVLVLIFEIIDLSNDDPHLQTVPQQIGMKRTKMLGLLLLIVFYFLEFLKIVFDAKQVLVNIVLVIVIAAFLIFANERKSKYYTSFWVESVPIFWWLLVVFFC
ncbi:MAG: hypothetical protein PSV16_10490 [Flavobacterium sp.]|nr:hypothetical protein [Flavobacterium sp.]